MSDRITGNWSDETEAALREHVGGGPDSVDTVTQATVEEISAALNRTNRSVASKLRNMGYTVASSVSARTPTFTEEAGEALADFVRDNSGNFTYAEIAANFANGAYSARQVQGKILSMEMTNHVRPTPPRERTSSYSDEDQATIVSMVAAGEQLEAIAEAVGRELNSVRGKCLSLYKQGVIEAIPTQATRKESASGDYFDGVENIGEMTVADIAQALGKTARGVKIALSRRGLSASDYTPNAA